MLQRAAAIDYKLVELLTPVKQQFPFTEHSYYTVSSRTAGHKSSAKADASAHAACYCLAAGINGSRQCSAWHCWLV
jgi:hypothetical protein